MFTDISIGRRKLPKIFPCYSAHTFCSGCINIIAKNSKPLCPVCLVSPIMDIAHPRTNTALTELLKTIDSLSCNVTNCKDCDNESAELYCGQCDVEFCVSCCENEHKNARRRNHTIVKMSDKTDAWATFRKPEKCKEDDQPLLLYCFSCSVPICVICQVSKRHVGHKIRSAKDIGEEKRQKLQNSIIEITSITASILTESNSLGRVTDLEAKSFLDAAPAIEAHFDAIFEALRRRKKSLLVEVKMIKRARDVNLTAAREAITSCQSQSMALKEATRLALLQPDLALVTNSASITRSFTTFKQDAAKILSQPSEFIGTSLDFSEALLQDICKVGRVNVLAIPQLTFILDRQRKYGYKNGIFRWSYDGTINHNKVLTFELQLQSDSNQKWMNEDKSDWATVYTGKELEYAVEKLQQHSHYARIRCTYNKLCSAFSAPMKLETDDEY